MLFLRQTHTLVRLNSPIRRYRHNLARLDIPYKLCSDRVKCARLGSQNIGIITLSNTKWPETIGISGTDQLSRRHDDQ